MQDLSISDRLKIIKLWFKEFDSDQKKSLICELISDCDFDSIKETVDNLYNIQTTSNLERLLQFLPKNIYLEIFSYLDVISLCRCIQVCKLWQDAGDDQILWRRLCNNANWFVSTNNRFNQNWKKDFAQQYRIRMNWLNGRCHVRTFEGHTQGICCVQFDETRIVSGSSDSTIKVWNMRTNSPLAVQTLVGHSSSVRCLYLYDNQLVSGSTDCTIKIWDLSDSLTWSSIACRATLQGHTDAVRCVSVCDFTLVSGSYDNTLKVWNLQTKQLAHTLFGHEDAVLCVQQSQHDVNGHLVIVSGSRDKTIKIWENHQCITTLCGHSDAVTCLQLQDGSIKRITSGSVDCTIKIWQDLVCIKTIDWKAAEGHTKVVRCLQTDNWRMISASDDKTIKIWNTTADAKRLVTLKKHSDGVTCVQFNDRFIVSGSYDKTVKLWDFSSC